MQADRVARTAAISALAACVAAVTITAALLARGPLVVWWTGQTAPPSTYRPGQHIDLSPEAYDGAPYTLLVFARAGCAACDQSKPVLSTLIGEMRAWPGSAVALVTPAAQAALGAQLAEELGLTAEEVVPIDTSTIKIQKVPAVALVDRQGEILKFHEGVLTDADRAWLSASELARLTAHR